MLPAWSLAGMTTIMMGNSEGKNSPDMKHDFTAYTNNVTKDQKLIIHLLLEENVIPALFTADHRKGSPLKPFRTPQQHKHIFHFSLQADDLTVSCLVVTCLQPALTEKAHKELKL